MRSWLVGHQILRCPLGFQTTGPRRHWVDLYLGRVWYWMVGKDRRRNVQQSQHARLPAGLVVQHMHTKARRRFSELIADGDSGSS